MPTYQYACTECGHAFDIVQSFSDDSLTVCPECGGRLRKVFNAVGVVFKGSGFYRTDSRGAHKETAGAGATASDPKPKAASTAESTPSGSSSTPAASGTSASTSSKPASSTGSGSPG